MKNERIPSAKEKDYQRRVNERMPKSKTLSQCIRAFVSGGIICCIGQLIHDFAKLTLNYSESNVAAFTAIVLVFIGATLTGVGIYDKIGAWAGAGSVVPITGFANSIVSPAMEFKREVRCIIGIVRENRNRGVSGLNPTKYAGKEVLEAAIIPHDFSLPQSQMDVADPSGSFYFPILL